MNIKRAFKTMAKLGDGRIYVQKLDKIVLVSNGHVIVTVMDNEYEENKQFLGEVTNMNLAKIGIEQTQKILQDVKITDVMLDLKGRTGRVIKTQDALGVVNEQYLNVMKDVGSSMMFKTALTYNSIGLLIESSIVNDTVYNLNVVLPIKCDVKDILEKVLA